MYNLEMNTKKLGEFIKEKRLKVGLSREALASQLNVTAGHINNVERGDRVPSPDLMIALAKLLGTTGAELITALEDEPQEELEPGRFLMFPRNFSKMDAEFIESVAGLLSEFIERERKPKPDAKDTWLNDREEAG